MIDAKKVEELISKRAELKAQTEIWREVWKFIELESQKSYRERNFIKLQAWNEALRVVRDKMANLNDEYDYLIEQIEKA